MSYRLEPVQSLNQTGISLQRRFLDYVAIGDDCWEWKGSINYKGYGRMLVGGKCISVHRLSHSLFIGPLRRRLQVCHTCDNPKCVRPSHLFLGTNADNQQDSKQKGRTALAGTKRRGEKHSLSKLTVYRVLSIFTDSRFQRVVAQKYGVCLATVNHIKTGRLWGWLTRRVTL